MSRSIPQQGGMSVKKRVFLVLSVVFLTSCSISIPANSSETIGWSANFPSPRLSGEQSLEETLMLRRSIRSFASDKLLWQQIGQLLWAAQGITSAEGKRTAPSAGACYPLEIFCFWDEGWGRYQPESHRLDPLGKDDRRMELAAASLDQSWIATAPVVFVVMARLERMQGKYGLRSERYATLEAGHAAQNLLLQATTMGLGGTPVGAFDDAAIQRITGESALPYYVIPIGVPLNSP